jgi:hypothetical protein
MRNQSKTDQNASYPVGGIIKTTVNLDCILHRNFKMHAAKQGRTMGSILEDLIRDALGEKCQKIKSK